MCEEASKFKKDPWLCDGSFSGGGMQKILSLLSIKVSSCTRVPTTGKQGAVVRGMVKVTKFSHLSVLKQTVYGGVQFNLVLSVCPHPT